MKKLFLTALTLQFCVACGKGHSANPVAHVEQAAADRDLQNTFATECSTSLPEYLATLAATQGASAVRSMKTEYTFAGENVTRSLIYYAKPDCNDAAFRFDERGTFNIDKGKKTNDGGYNIDLHFKKVAAKAHGETGVNIGNQIGICRIKDWTDGKERDVTDHSADVKCYAAAEPRTQYNVYRVDAGTLTLGLTDTSANAEKDRPASLKGLKFTSTTGKK